jgi:hypothetical protein
MAFPLILEEDVDLIAIGGHLRLIFPEASILLVLIPAILLLLAPGVSILREIDHIGLWFGLAGDEGFDCGE